MWIIIFAAVVGLVYFAAKLKEFYDLKEKLSSSLGTGKFQVLDSSKWIRVAYICISIFGIGSGYYGYLTHDNTTVALGIIVFFVFLSEMLIVEFRFKFYYNTTSFISNGNLVRYKSIKEFEENRRIPIAFIKVVTFNGEKFPVSPKSHKVILGYMNNRQNKNK